MGAGSEILVSGSGALILSNRSGGIVGGVSESIFTSVPGAFTLGGGATDFPAFSTARTKNRWRMFQFQVLATGWTCPGFAMIGPQTTANQNLLITDIHNGATLSSVTFAFAWESTIPGTQPANPPTFNVLRYPMSSGGTFVGTSLNTGGAQAQNSLSLASNNIQSFTFNCNQDNVIDATNYTYAMQIVDQSGTNSELMLYVGYQVSYSQIAGMAFP